MAGAWVLPMAAASGPETAARWATGRAEEWAMLLVAAWEAPSAVVLGEARAEASATQKIAASAQPWAGAWGGPSAGARVPFGIFRTFHSRPSHRNIPQFSKEYSVKPQGAIWMAILGPDL